MVKTPQGTEEKILAAAKKVFHRKGYEGARMQEIADEAGINKALLHYYFRSKEKLFEEVFKAAFSEISKVASHTFTSDEPMIRKIEAFVSTYLDIITENSYIPWFIINGIYERPEQIKKIFDRQRIDPPAMMEGMREQIRREFNVEVTPIQFWLNILSLCVFPIVAKPLIREIFRMSEEGYQEILEERKTFVPHFIINALKAYEKENDK